MAALISLCCTAVSFGAHGEHEENVCYCNHNYVFLRRYNEYIKLSSMYCEGYHVEKNICTKCDQIIEASRTYLGTFAHDDVVKQATCDGRTQTWTFRCRYCNTYMHVEYHACPAAPHGGQCDFLPCWSSVAAHDARPGRHGHAHYFSIITI